MMTEHPTTLEDWWSWLKSYTIDDTYLDDKWAHECCILALKAVEEGNFGVGCVLLGPDGQVVTRGHNQVFQPHFRSDRHAEMVVMDDFEDQNPSIASMKGYRLYSSLESCPMCMARLIASGCEAILYVAPDLEGGMVHLESELPPIWRRLVDQQHQRWDVAECSPELKSAAFQIFLINAEELNNKLSGRSGAGIT